MRSGIGVCIAFVSIAHAFRTQFNELRWRLMQPKVHSVADAEICFSILISIIKYALDPVGCCCCYGQSAWLCVFQLRNCNRWELCSCMQFDSINPYMSVAETAAKSERRSQWKSLNKLHRRRRRRRRKIRRKSKFSSFRYVDFRDKGTHCSGLTFVIHHLYRFQ